jgi:hypothetical protein
MIPLSRRALATLLLLPFLAACASSGGGGGGRAQRLRVTLRDYTQGARFELVSESHTDRVTYYSQARSDAARKVQTDEVMRALVREIDGKGFGNHSQEGPAPSQGGRALSRSIEVERDGAVEHWPIGNGSQVDERQAFHVCVDEFLQLYNISASFQAVENPVGRDYFEESQQRALEARGKKPKG